MSGVELPESPEYLAVYEAVREEVRGLLPHEEQRPTAEYVGRWAQTRNPYYMDIVSVKLAARGVTPTPTIAAQMAKAAAMRLSGSVAGTYNKILKENRKAQAFGFMANIIYYGLTLEVAASKAARVFQEFKASTLERQYTETWRARPEAHRFYCLEEGQFYEVDKQSLEEKIFEVWRSHIPDHAEQWRPIIEAIPEVDDDQKGYRR